MSKRLNFETSIIRMVIISIIMISSISIYSHAQMASHLFDEEEYTNLESEIGIDSRVLPDLKIGDKRIHAAFAEVFGAGFTVNFFYDVRFDEQAGGLGARFGFGGFAVEGEGILSVPIQLNYLLGKNQHFFELGAGVTLLPIVSGVFFLDQPGTVYGTMFFGYRLQPLEGGFSFRAGLTPVFGDVGGGFTFIPYWFGISFGYCW